MFNSIQSFYVIIVSYMNICENTDIISNAKVKWRQYAMQQKMQ